MDLLSNENDKNTIKYGLIAALISTIILSVITFIDLLRYIL
jgi:Flp pilus assembly pilin Flp